MTCRILVKNTPNSWNHGDVIEIFSGDHVFSKYESKTKFVASGHPIEDWSRHFVIINIIDADKSELSFLLEQYNDERKYYLVHQGIGSPFHAELSLNAEVTATKLSLLSVMADRTIS